MRGCVGSPCNNMAPTHPTRRSQSFTLKDADMEGEDSWVHLLPIADVRTFTAELFETMRAADSAGNGASAPQALIAWQHTAEVYSDPELLAAALTRDHGEAYGPAPDPRDVA